jgi:hypothetical protein
VYSLLRFGFDDLADKNLDARCRYGTYRNIIQHTFGNLRRRRRYGTYRNTLQRYKMIFGSVSRILNWTLDSIPYLRFYVSPTQRKQTSLKEVRPITCCRYSVVYSAFVLVVLGLGLFGQSSLMRRG